MPILWMAAEAAETGVIGEAMARAAQAEADLGGVLMSGGALIMGGIAYFFGPFPWAPPSYPSCTAVPSSWLGGYTGGDDPDVLDLGFDTGVDFGGSEGGWPPGN